VCVDSTCAASQLPGCFENADLLSGGGQFDGAGKTGPAAADDGNVPGQPFIHVRQAIQSLRSGVSEVR